ncbi:MAG: hypothetical protein E7310_07690 [Clostridiales bacterium]|nr:hypothetical protein [Clostridiales bacterium]
MKEDLEQEISRLNVLKDIYKNENERLKYEYRVLLDEFEKYKNSIKEPTVRKILRKCLSIVKRIFKR